MNANLPQEMTRILTEFAAAKFSAQVLEVNSTSFERGGNWVTVLLGASPYTAAFARLGKICNAGITDLRYGSLVDEDWQGRDRFARDSDMRRVVPLPEGTQCYTIGVMTATRPGRPNAPFLGDGLVPLHSALGQHADPARSLPFPELQQWTGYGMGHLDLPDREEVYQQIRRWLD